MSGYRSQRINEEVKRELAEIFREIKDPRVPSMISVLAVDVTPDLKYAKAYVSVMGTPEQVKEAAKGLKSSAPFIRREIGKRLDLRNAPEFSFICDNSIERGANINKILKDIEDDS